MSAVSTFSYSSRGRGWWLPPRATGVLYRVVGRFDYFVTNMTSGFTHIRQCLEAHAGA
jgi:hypothetical protein